MALPINIEEFDEYIRQGEPDKKEKTYIWQTIIGLQRRCLRTSGRKALCRSSGR